MKRILFVGLFCLLAAGGAAAQAPLSAFVSVPPQKFLLQRVGGGHVRVSVMLTPGQAPETFDPSARQIQRLAGAKVYFLAGVPFETAWVDTMEQAYPELRIVHCCGDLAPEQMVDPHYWTSPENAIHMAQTMYETLAGMDPDREGVYKSNLDRLTADLKQLDAYIRTKLLQRRTDVFITAHAAWGWFAQSYGLEEVALEKNGREIGPRGLAQIMEIARRERIHTVFVQDQFKTPVVGTLAKRLNARLVTLDPLAEDYIGNMRSVADKLAKAQQ
jgi:zinc transport system substrate-binding protein